MQFNFDKINDRRNANSSKWQVKEHELPMWVADMDIQTAPAIITKMLIVGFLVINTSLMNTIEQLLVGTKKNIILNQI